MGTVEPVVAGKPNRNPRPFLGRFVCGTEIWDLRGFSLRVGVPIESDGNGLLTCCSVRLLRLSSSSARARSICLALICGVGPVDFQGGVPVISKLLGG